MRKLWLGLFFFCATSLHSQAPNFASKVDSSPSMAPAIPYDDYKIEPGDTIEVLYRKSPEFNQTVIVQPRGFVTLQLIGEVRLEGLTLKEAQGLITSRASERLNDPEVSLSLKDFDKPHFTVMGEVTNPGRYELRGSISAIDALAMAGGFKPTSKHTEILLVHRENNHVKSTQVINYKDLENQQKLTKYEFFKILPGDIMIVPQNKLSKVERYVKLINAGVYYNPVP